MATQTDVELMEKFGQWVGEVVKNMPEGYKLSISGTPFGDGYMRPAYLEIEIIPNGQEFK